MGSVRMVVFAGQQVLLANILELTVPTNLFENRTS